MKDIGVDNANNMFRLIREIEITVSEDYIHGKSLSVFKKENQDKFYIYKKDMTDEHFARVSHRLVPGKKYLVKIFESTLSMYESEFALSFLKAQSNAVLTGAQGLAAIWPVIKNGFPKNRGLVSFDEKDALWEDANGDHCVPNARYHSFEAWDFDLASFEKSTWLVGAYLLCFCDLPAGEAGK